MPLEIRMDADFLPMPPWTQFFMALGENFSDYYDLHGGSLKMAVVTPARNFAATMLALGIVKARVRKIDLATYFESLIHYPKDTPVLLYNSGRRRNGLLKGSAVLNGTRYVRVQVQNESGGDLTEYIQEKLAESVVVREGADIPKLPKSQRGRRAEPFPPIWRQFSNKAPYGPERTDVVLVGRPKELDTEANWEIRTAEGDRFCSGRIQDLLSLVGLSGVGPVHHGMMVSNRIRKPKLPTPDTVVLFSDSSTYVRLAAKLQTRCSIVVIDRLSSHCTEAIQMFNASYAGRTGAKVLLQVAPPPGVEYLAYREEQ